MHVSTVLKSNYKIQVLNEKKNPSSRLLRAYKKPFRRRMASHRSCYCAAFLGLTASHIYYNCEERDQTTIVHARTLNDNYPCRKKRSTDNVWQTITLICILNNMTAALTLAKFQPCGTQTWYWSHYSRVVYIYICYVGQSNNNRRRAQITDDFALLR